MIRYCPQQTFNFFGTLTDNSKSIYKPTTFRNLGRVLLCGVLHVTFATNERVKGQYIICTLYRSTLVLATLSKNPNIYQVVVAIPMVNATIEAADSGRGKTFAILLKLMKLTKQGLQCHTAPYTWKLIFDVDRRQHEVILSACSEKEEEV
jgi:hypothetical protein